MYDDGKLIPIACLSLAALFLIGASILIYDTAENPVQEAEVVIDDVTKILLVPGHDEEYLGTRHGDLKEKDLTLQLSQMLYERLLDKEGVEVYITRDENGYTSFIQKYFEENEKEINRLKDENRNPDGGVIDSNEFEKIQIVQHNTAPEEVAFRLYGINSWANENDIDLVLHIHFNDYPGRGKWEGRYGGFSIYVPQNGYDNGEESIEIGNRLRDGLNDIIPESNLPTESDIVIEGSDLMAIGPNNSLKSNSVLLETGYIYEPHFVIPEHRVQIFSVISSVLARDLLDLE